MKVFKLLSLLALLSACSVESAKVPIDTSDVETESEYSLEAFSQASVLQSTTMFMWKEKETMPRAMQVSAELSSLKAEIQGLLQVRAEFLSSIAAYLRDRMGDGNFSVYAETGEAVVSNYQALKLKASELEQEEAKPVEEQNAELVQQLKEEVQNLQATLASLQAQKVEMEDTFLTLEEKQELAKRNADVDSVLAQVLEKKQKAEAVKKIFVSLVDMMPSPPQLTLQVLAGEAVISLANFEAHVSRPSTTEAGSVMGVSIEDNVLQFTAICQQRAGLEPGLIDAYTFQVERVNKNTKTLKGDFVRCTNTQAELMAGNCGLARYGVVVFN